jgi:hypothetical protein
MGHKVNPIGLRLGINRTWDSRWFARKGEYVKLLHEDIKIRDALLKDLKQAAVSKIVIERPHKKCRVSIYSARPGIVIGKKGADIEKLRKKVGSMTASEVHINIVEVRKPEVYSTLVAASASTARAVSAAPKSRGPSGTARAGCRCTRCAPTSITGSPPRRPRWAPAASRSGFSRAKSWSTTPWLRTGA